MQVIVNGLSTHYALSGSKTKYVLLLHGWGDDASSFNKLARSLNESFGVLAIDLPGFGKTDTPKQAWGLADYANHVSVSLTKLDLGSPYAIIGHSNGGAIAIKAVGDRFIQTSKLVLLASSGIRTEYKGRKKILRLGAKTAKFITSPLPKKTKEKLKKKAYQSIGSEIFIAEGMQETFKKIISEDIIEIAQKISVPTLLLYGSGDSATPPRYGDKLKSAIHGSQLKVIEGSGHFLHLEKPELINNTILEFLNA